MGVEIMRELERMILLDRIDSHWKDHLYNIDYLEEGIHLRGYGGKDPIVVFKNEALDVFESMHQRIEEDVCEYVFKAQLNIESREEKRSRTPARRKDKKQAMPRRRATRSNRPKRRKR
jgi:preprotein translocase subunit SecA